MTAFITAPVVVAAFSASSAVMNPVDLPRSGDPATQHSMQEQVPHWTLATDASSIASSSSFEPVLPEAATLVGFGVLVLLCGAAAWVWAEAVVPVSRTKLALSKKNGPVRVYLDELREAAHTNGTDVPLGVVAAGNFSVARSDDRAWERWLFADWLEKPQSAKGGRKKDPALPILKDAKWNSGDNPVLVATALILLGVIVTAITERLSTTIGF